MMLERLALVLLLGLAAVALFRAFRLAHMRRMGAAAGSGLPSLLYFSSETCGACPAQSRYVEQLAAQWDGRLRVEHIDATQEPDAAARYRVFTLPTTILVGADGGVRQVNYGLTSADKLDQQIRRTINPAVAG